MADKTIRVVRRVCALFAAMLLALIGGFTLLKVEKTSAENEERMQATSLVSANADVNISNEKGVRLSSDTSYSGEIKGKFEGDTTLKFSFPETYTDWFGGDFKVRVTDATDDTNYFEVHYRANTDGSGYHHTQGYVLYGGQIRSSRYWSSTEQYYNSYRGWGDALVAPSFRSWYEKGDDTSKNVSEGVLSFVWTGDVLSVQVYSNANGKTRTIAEFDGSEEFKATDTPSWGLPKLRFENGYVLSVSSSFTNAATTDSGSDVLFTAIENGDEVCNLTATEIVTPSFYTKYIQWKAESPLVSESIEGLVETNGVASSDNGLRISSDNAYTGALKGKFYGNTTLKFRFPEENTEWWSGQFSVRFTNATNVNEYFEVEYRNVEEQYKYTGAFVSYKGQVRTSRYWQSANAWRNSYVNGEYALCAPTFGNARDVEGVLSLVWEKDVLQVQVSHFTNGSMRTIAAFDGTNEFISGTSWGLPKLNFENGYIISFSSQFVHNDTTDKGTDVCFNEIAGVNFTTQSEIQTVYKYEAKFENAIEQDAVLYIPQNEDVGDISVVYTRCFSGESWLERETVDVTKAIDTSIIGEKTFVLEDDAWKQTSLGAIKKEYTLCVEKPYTLTFDTKGGEVIAPIVYSEHTVERIVVSDAEKLFWQFDGWYEGEQKFNGDLSGLYNRNVTLTAKWKDVTAPVISLASGIPATQVKVKNETVTLSETDVIAADSAQNETISVSIAWKTENGVYTGVDSGYSLNLAEKGAYSVRYTAKDGAGLTAEIVREIIVVERFAPVLSAEGEYKNSEFIGASVPVITVMAQDSDGNALPVSLTVSKDGKKIEVVNGKFEVNELGKYQITYTATDENGLVGLLTYEMEVVEDKEAPSISVDFDDKEVEKGTRITLPIGLATDNVKEGVSLSVKVAYGTENIPIENNSFIASKNGTYTVTYVAVDKAGNMSQEIFNVTVKDEPKEGNGGAGCNGSISTNLPFGSLLVSVMVVLGRNLMMKKYKIKENE